jgi:hypothetical protein
MSDIRLAFLFFIFCIAGIEARALHMLGKLCTSEPQTQPQAPAS